MNQRIKHFGIMTLAAWSIFSTSVSAQSGSTAAPEPVKLSIGDPSPKLKFSKWLQGQPVNEIKADKIYVVEFWATWCGPCIHAMPHLSELAEKYGKSHVFIGCNVLEKTGDKPYESSTAKVTSFVKRQKELKRMTYNVIMDNNAQDMNKNWLVAAGIEGIPTTFVILQGKIAWIGHPDSLDSILASIADGSFDIEKSKQEYAKEHDPAVQFQKKLKENKDRIAKAEAEKDYSKALEYAEQAMAGQPEYQMMYIEDKFRVLMKHFSEEKAMAYGDEIVKKGGLDVEVLLAYLYMTTDHLSDAMNQYAVKVARTMKQNYPKSPDILATFEARAGYYAEAAVSEQKAIDMAKALIKEKPEMEGYFNADVIKEYHDKLEDYKKKAVK